jgi:hypothetical protein
MDSAVRVWAAAEPLEGSLKQTVLMAQVLTGMELDAAGGLHVLDAAAWHARRQNLQEQGALALP